MTYSIVARDPETGVLGVAAQSHFFSVGSVATFAEAGVGAISTQAFASRQYGALGIPLLSAGLPAQAVLDALLALDPNRELRQVGIVDAQGRAAAYTGTRCMQHASHVVADGVCVQGNMLASPQIPAAMIEASRSARGDLAARMLAALDAAEAAGGDARGRQSANLLMVAAQRSDQPWHALLHDERVDDHPVPLAELRRLVELRRAYHGIGGILFEEGPLFSDVGRTDAGAVAQAIDTLTRSAQALGDTQYEATLWQAILLARFGRIDEAALLVPGLLRSEPKLEIFIRNLAPSGFLDADSCARLLAAGATAAV